jgi:hypothetical protein
MPKKSTKRSLKRRGKSGTRKQKPIMMIGCSKKNKKSCSKCGPNCHCGPNCKCEHPCPGNCYLNRRMKKQKGGRFDTGFGSGCGSCGCPLSPLSWPQMNKFGGNKLQNLIPGYAHSLNEPVIQSPTGDFTSIPGTNQNGGTCGTCGTCGQMPVVPQAGGNFYKLAGPIPGPFVGKPWGGDLKWPGDNGIGGDRNYLANYGGVIQNDPQQQMSMNNAGYKTMNSMVGGYRYDKADSSKSSSKTYKKGGGLIPQDLVNLGRDFTYNFKTAYNALNGYKAPVNPLPYKGQLTGALNNNRFMI